MSTRAAVAPADPLPAGREGPNEPGPTSGHRRAAGLGTLVVAISGLFFLLFNHAHFKGSDELAVFEMTRSLADGNGLAVPPLRHTAIGRDGQRYSYFAAGQAVLALPLFAAAAGAEEILPSSWQRAISGLPLERGVYRFGGALDSTFVGMYAPIVTALLVGLYFAFQRALGASPRSAFLASLLLAGTTQVALHSTYFLRHSTESLCILGAFYLFFRFKQAGRLRDLAFGAALAVSIPLIRVPAAIAAPALAAYLAHVLYTRASSPAQPGARANELWRWALAIFVPCLVAAALHGWVNAIKWGDWLSSPMVGQQSRLVNPLFQGLAGLLLSPGSSIFVWSPLLLLLPVTLPGFFRERRAEAWACVGLAVSLLLFYARFDGWSGLWSAPGPRYLVPLIPVLMLPLGAWLDRNRGRAARTVLSLLAALGAFVQVVSMTIKWGSVQRLAGYPPDDPDHAGFLFELGHSPLAEMTRILASGGPVDPWLLNLAAGWPGFDPRPGLAIALFGAVSLALAVSAALSIRVLRAAVDDV